MGAFTDMLLPDKGSGEEREKVEQNDDGDPLPGTARHREFYPEGVANILQVCFYLIWSRILSNCFVIQGPREQPFHDNQFLTLELFTELFVCRDSHEKFSLLDFLSVSLGWIYCLSLCDNY